MKKIIGIIGNHPIVAHGLRGIIEEFVKSSEIIVAENLEQFLKLNKRELPDLLILGAAGITNAVMLETVKQVSKKFSNSGIILVDRRLNGRIIQAYFDNGVSGYLPVNSDLQEIKQCLLKVMAGLKYIPADLILYLLDEKNGLIKSAPKMLTKRENQIAKLLLEGKGTQLIAKQLDRRPSTISTIKKNIFRKMNVSGILQLDAVVSADGYGAR
ncbi:hypothetical protein DSL64_28515 [Dyadobacter luteus]|uniref:DNA-binding response regulator n=1 Tax=Dyadobacter luteus TaxID=2259619 RepID=A0A3D8Y3K3_9BACT|nr:response regulator transcription factor [Dyadobacter luteus]REA55192.1 hypothetical protein DSL64_28515 [Dyadobacter luteus]